MNILLIAKHLNIGGIGWYTVNLARYLKKLNVNVFVASCGGELVRELDKDSIVHLALDLNTKSEISPKVFFAVNKLSQFVRENKIELVHAQTRVTQVLSYFVAKQTGIAYVSTCHGFYKIRFWRKLFPFLGRRVIFVSEYCKNSFSQALSIPPEKIKVIHNGIDLAKFHDLPDDKSKEEVKDMLGLDLNNPVIGTIARLSPAKRIDILLEVFKKVKSTIPQAQLLIIGGGPEEENLKQKARMLSILENVKFVDSVSSTVNALSAIDVFVTCTEVKSFGLGIVEAMAGALAVVASRVGGIPEVLKDKKNGFLVNFNDQDGFKELIIMLLKDKQLRLSIGQEARKSALSYFSLERMAKQTLEVYQEVLS